MTPEYETHVKRHASPAPAGLPWSFQILRDGALLLAGAARDEVEARESAAMLVAMLQIKRGDA